jgi:hypothetical protein
MDLRYRGLFSENHSLAKLIQFKYFSDAFITVNVLLRKEKMEGRIFRID